VANDARPKAFGVASREAVDSPTRHASWCQLVDIGQSTVGVSGCWPGGKACGVGSPAGPSDRTKWWIALKSSSDIALPNIGRSLSGVKGIPGSTSLAPCGLPSAHPLKGTETHPNS
jgi:hypothetical protein